MAVSLLITIGSISIAERVRITSSYTPNKSSLLEHEVKQNKSNKKLANVNLENFKIIKNNYLVNTIKTGYYFGL